MEEIGTEMLNNASEIDYYDREKELKSLDNTKAGVKGLVDAGIDSVPKIFIRPLEKLSEDSSTQNINLQVPVIDLKGIRDATDCREEMLREILCASEKWGFFQVINHGIPIDVLDKMLRRVRMFHEQDAAVKEEFYTRDMTKQVVYNTNYDLYKSKAANWRDTFTINNLYSGHLDPKVLPPVCRDAIMDYTSNIISFSNVQLDLISEALGLRQCCLKEMESNKGWYCACHYYPACPDPELTMGSTEHTDPSFLTVLLQDQLGGLQVLQDNQWVDVQPVPDALVVNIGDILQMISNDKLKSVYHRVKANRAGPRISVAFFLTGLFSSPKTYQPLQELTMKEHQPVYREFTLGEFASHFFSRPLGKPAIEHFKIRNCVDEDDQMSAQSE